MDQILPIIILLLVIGIPIILILMRRDEPHPKHQHPSVSRPKPKPSQKAPVVPETVKLPNPPSWNEPEPEIITILRRQQEEEQRRRKDAEERARVEHQRIEEARQRAKAAAELHEKEEEERIRRERQEAARQRFASLVTKILDDLRRLDDRLQYLVQLVDKSIKQADFQFERIQKSRDDTVSINELFRIPVGEYSVTYAEEKLRVLDADRHFAEKYLGTLDQIENEVRRSLEELDSIPSEFASLGNGARQMASNLLASIETVRSRVATANTIISERYLEAKNLFDEAAEHLESLKSEQAKNDQERRRRELETLRARQEQERESRAKEKRAELYPDELTADYWVCVTNGHVCSRGHELLPKNVSVIVIDSEGARKRVKFQAAICPECHVQWSRYVYFVDRSTQNEIRQIGIPLWRVISWDDYSRGKFDGFNEESVLRQFGYSVSQQAGLTAEARQDILDFVLSAKLYRRRQLIGFLRMLRDQASGVFTRDMSSAIAKWDEDIDYLQHSFQPKSSHSRIVETIKISRSNPAAAFVTPRSSNMTPAESFGRDFKSEMYFWKNGKGRGWYVCDLGNWGFEVQYESDRSREQIRYDSIPDELYVLLPTQAQ